MSRLFKITLRLRWMREPLGDWYEAIDAEVALREWMAERTLQQIPAVDIVRLLVEECDPVTQKPL